MEEKDWENSISSKTCLSNIIELLKDTLTVNLHLVGKIEFYRGLDKIILC